MSKESKQLNIYCNFYPLCCRMVREVSYREFMKHHDDDPEPPRISDKAYKAGSFIKCPLRWTQGAIKAIHEGARIIYDKSVRGCQPPGYSCQEDYCAARDIQLARHIRGEKDWSYLGYKD